MLIVRDFSNMFQRMSGMPVNSRGGQDMLKGRVLIQTAGSTRRLCRACRNMAA